MYFSGVNPVKAFIKDPELAWSFFVDSGIRVAYAKFFNDKLRLSRYAGKKVLVVQSANEMLKQKIIEGKPYMFGRFGSVELWFVTEVLLNEKGLKSHIDVEELLKSCINCGFFPAKEEHFRKFRDIMVQSCSQVDLFGTFRMILEDYFIKHYMKNDVVLSHLYMMDFWMYDEPFTAALKGKKVLVIHPLSNQIQRQYKIRERLFENPNVLPEFELITQRAVQTAGGAVDERFETWFDALDYMYDEAMKVEFDIAIIGCGAYGFPLAAKLKAAGKSAIHMGGVTQMLFGIKGSRWDIHPEASMLYNEYWVRPDESEVPTKAADVEDKCYW